MSSVVIIQTAFIGDVVLATPLAGAARAACPGREIVFVVRHGCESLVETNPHVDRVIIWDKHGAGRGIRGMLAMASELHGGRDDIALIPHRSIRSAATAALGRIGTRVGFDRGGGQWLHTRRVPYRRDVHEVERNLALAGALGWETDGFTPQIVPGERDRAFVDDVVRGLGRFCVLAPGSVWATKMWPAEHYEEIGRALAGKGYTVVVSGGSDDSVTCGRIAAGVPGAIDLCGVLGLRQSAELYRRSAFVLTGDTAPQHLAAAVGARVVSLFGPTVREFGFWPYTERGLVIEENLDCRPCGIHGHRTCPEGHHRCMRTLVPARVLDEVLAFAGE